MLYINQIALPSVLRVMLALLPLEIHNPEIHLLATIDQIQAKITSDSLISYQNNIIQTFTIAPSLPIHDPMNIWITNNPILILSFIYLS